MSHLQPGDGGQVDPRFLATAVEAIVRAGDLQIAKFGTAIRVDKKGTIDLVTEVEIGRAHV